MGTGTKRIPQAADSLVRAYLHQRAASFDVILHPRAFRSIDEARAIGVDAGDVLKSLVIRHAEGRVVAVLPASRRLDMHRVHRVLGDAHATLAAEDEIRSAYPAYELGALPPIASLLDAPVLLDPTVFEHETVVFAAGTQTESLRMRPEDLFTGEDFRVARITHEPHEAERTDESDG